jgi:hypothetical protein
MSDDKRWVVREGTVRGEGSYLELGGTGAFTDDGWHPDQKAATRMTREAAEEDAAVIEGTARVVRLLTREEAKAKAEQRGIDKGRAAMRTEVMALVTSVLFDGSGEVTEFVHAVECLR